MLNETLVDILIVVYFALECHGNI